MLPVLSWRHAKAFFELPVEVGQILKTGLFGNGENCGVATAQFFCCGTEPVFIQMSHKGSAGHLLKPTHEMTRAASAVSGSLGNGQRVGIVLVDKAEHAFEPPGISRIGIGQRYILQSDQYGEKAQQDPPYCQFITGKTGSADFFQILQTVFRLSEPFISKPQPVWERKPSGLQRQDIPLGAEVAAAQQIQRENDVLVLHDQVCGLPDPVNRTGGKDKDISGGGAHGTGPGLHDSASLLDIDQFHAILPVKAHLRKVHRDAAWIEVKSEVCIAVMLLFIICCIFIHTFPS